MKKLEQQFNTRFNHWLKAVHKNTGAFELKHTRGKSYLNFAEVKPHQIAALRAAKNGVLAYKISDIGRVQLPFDCICLSGVPAYVVIQYPDVAYGIDVDEFVRTRDSSSRKSLTQDEAEVVHSFKL